MAESPRPVESSVRAYDVLVKSYPASFRREYRDEMTLVFRELVTDAWRRRGVAGLTAAWFRVLGDLAGLDRIVVVRRAGVAARLPVGRGVLVSE